MTSLLGRALARAMPVNTLDARDAIFGYGGNTYPTGAIMSPLGAGDREGGTSTNYEQVFAGTLRADGPVAACFLARRMLLSEARFVWQRMQRGRPTTIFGSAELALLETPWPNGTTGQLISRMSDLEGLAGNAFVVRRGEARLGDERLVVPRPDWMVIVGGRADEAPSDVWDLDVDVIGYLYFPGGPLSGRDPVPLLVDDVAHYAPNPDPMSRWRGMSWLTPVLREVDSDKAATEHKAAFFRNGASPQIVVSFDAAIKQEQVLKMAAQLNALTTGTGNAYKTLYLGGGADVTVVGRDLAQLDFANTQGRDETRIAAAAGIHPVVLGLSEGLSGSSLNAGNFQAARRLTADRTLRPLWRFMCDALGTITPVPTPDNPTRGNSSTPVRLWIDERDIPFLREDVKDIADAQLVRAQAIAALVREGFEPSSVVAYVDSDDVSLLVHTGAVSVQLQKPGQQQAVATPPQDGAAQGAGQDGQAAPDTAGQNGQRAPVGRGGIPLGGEAGRYSPHQPRRPDGKFGHGGGVPAASGGNKAPLSDAEYEAHTRMVEAKIGGEIKAGRSTDAMHSLDGQGQVWSPERARQHKEIVDELWGNASNVPNDGNALIAGGLGGAGKSTVLGKHAGVRQSDYLTVNPDDVKEHFARRGMIPQVEGLSPMEASALVHEESSHVANMLAQRAYGERKNMIWDITMSSQGSVEKRISEMRRNGYGNVKAVFVDIPVETSVQRALSRHRRGMEDYRNGDGLGGRYVPPSIIRKNKDPKWSSANRGVFEALKGRFDSWQVWDNSGGPGETKKISASPGG